MSDDDPKRKLVPRGGSTTATTVELPQPPKWAIELTQAVVDIRTRIESIESNVKLVEGETKTIATRVGTLETRLNEMQQRQDQHSDARDLLHQRIERQSATDVEHESAIAKEREERAALAKQVSDLAQKTNAIGEDVVAVKKAVVGVLENPKVRAFAKVIFVLAMSYAATRDIRTPPPPPAAPPAAPPATLQP